jgi:hypothetical protein
MHIVELDREGNDIAATMEQMRTWLDRVRVQPALFTISLSRERTVFRVALSSINDARAFARAMGGKLVAKQDGDTENDVQ